MSNLKQLIIDRYNPSELIDLFEGYLTTEELLDYIWDYVMINLDKFEDEFEIDEKLYK